MSERAPLGALLVPLLTRAMAAAPEATARALLAEVDPAAVAEALGELLEADPDLAESEAAERAPLLEAVDGARRALTEELDSDRHEPRSWAARMRAALVSGTLLARLDPAAGVPQLEALAEQQRRLGAAALVGQPELERALERALAAVVGGLTTSPAAGRADAIGAALRFAAFGALEPLIASVPADERGAVAAEVEAQLTPEAADADARLRLIERLLRGDGEALRAFLERQQARFPRLLDAMIETARRDENWAELLELAQRAIELREARARYTQLAAMAREKLGQALP